MKLVLKGFHQQNLVSPSQLVEAVKRIPEGHLKGLTHIVYDPSRFFQRSYVRPQISSRAVMGEYHSPAKSFVCLYNFRNHQECLAILYHEVGHHVFQHLLTPKLRKVWVTELSRSEGYVSEYAKTNAQEDFAETYSCYFHTPGRLARCPRKTAFVRDIIEKR